MLEITYMKGEIAVLSLKQVFAILPSSVNLLRLLHIKRANRSPYIEVKYLLA